MVGASIMVLVFDGFSCYLRHEYIFDRIQNEKDYKPYILVDYKLLNTTRLGSRYSLQ
jgi:hypothetical protein